MFRKERIYEEETIHRGADSFCITPGGERHSGWRSVPQENFIDTLPALKDWLSKIFDAYVDRKKTPPDKAEVLNLLRSGAEGKSPKVQAAGEPDEERLQNRKTGLINIHQL